MEDKNLHIIHQYLNREIDIEEVKRKLSEQEFQKWKNTLEEVENLPKPTFDVEREFEWLQQKKNSTKTKSQFPFLKIAAVLILLLSTSLFILTYNGNDQAMTNVSSTMAKEDFVNLPDGSQVRLNSMSNITFSQNNWEEERTVALEGEAYFDVEEGKTFTVETIYGTVQVLGTTFNVNSSDNRFSVTCYSGRVKVKFDGKEVVLEPGQTIDKANQQINLVNTSKPNWMMSHSSFESVPLADVIADIENQKNIKIQLKISDSISFTGAYDHKMEAEEILELVCRSLGLNYTKLNSSTFEISSEDN